MIPTLKVLAQSLLIFCLPTLSYAIFCPTNFNQIDYGSSIDQVMAQCGKPAIQETKDVPKEGPQEWNYFIPQTVGTQALTPMQGTLKTQVTFDSEGKAINISVNGIGVGSSSICGAMIRLGDTRDTIKSACGDPSFINKQQGTSSVGAAEPPDKVTTVIYNTNPPTTLIFINGQFTEKK